MERWAGNAKSGEVELIEMSSSRHKGPERAKPKQNPQAGVQMV